MTDSRLLESACQAAAESPEFKEWARAGAVGATWLGRAAVRSVPRLNSRPASKGLLAALEGS